MHRLPILIRNRKQQSRFSSPLSGLVYDNLKFQAVSGTQPEEADLQKSNFKKCSTMSRSVIANNKISPLNKSLDITTQIASQKIFNLSKRLSEPKKAHCSRSRWQKNEVDSSHISLTKKNLQRAIASNSTAPHPQVYGRNSSFSFPNIDVLVLDLFYCPADRDKVVNISLRKYFEMYFREGLSGLLYWELISTVEKYIQMLPANKVSPPEPELLIGITTKRSLLERIYELQKSDKTELILQLVQHYCLPTRQARAIFLRDVLQLLAVELFEAFNARKGCEYVLVKTDGKVVEDFSEISFMTNHLFISQKKTYQANYDRYLNILKDSGRQKNANSFRQTLKESFRRYVVRGQYIEGQPHPKSPKQKRDNSRENLEKAERIVEFKKLSNSRTRFIFKDTRRVQRRATKQKTSQKEEVKLFAPKIELSKDGQAFYKEFTELRLKNEFDDSVFRNDTSLQGKIQVVSLAKNCVYFRTKNPQQKARILHALRWQQPGKVIDYDDYVQMRGVVSCVGAKEPIVDFIDRYFRYDEYGELCKQSLEEVLKIAIGDESKSVNIILRTVWGWFEKSKVIYNGILRRNDIRTLYQRNKLVYLFLTSLIFGTNETSTLELAQDFLL